MHCSIRSLTVAVALSLTFIAGYSANLAAQTVVETPDQILAAATKASLKGDFAKALNKSRGAFAAAGDDLSFTIRFVDAVVGMADVSDARHRTSLLNEALKGANKLEISKAGDGTRNAEFAWHYMSAIGKLGDTLIDSNPRIAKKILAARAKIATNLQSNPGFPKVSLGLLAEPLMSAAYAKAIDKDIDGTISAMTTAMDAGFTNFDQLSETDCFAKLESDKVNKLIETRFSAYKKQLKSWARDSVNNFTAFDFKFDVADIDTGRIRHTDFEGRILVLDLWATWCPPCREAIPHFVKLDKEFRSDNVDIVGVSMDSPDNPRQSIKVVRKFVDENGVEYAMAMGDRSMMNQLAPGQKLPTVLFIDSQGKVRFIAEGPHNFHQLAAITNELIRQEQNSPTGLPASHLNF